MNVSKFVINSLQKKYSIDKNVDISTLDYMESGYVDSLGIIQFVVELEEEFGIEFTEEELSSPSFRIVGELIQLIEGKVMKNGES